MEQAHGEKNRARDRHRTFPVDFSAFPGLTTELVTSYIKAQIEKLRAMGYEADSCLIDLGDTAEAVAAAALGAKHYDCVVIGAGLREPRERLQLFERIINLVHLGAPQTRICFNTTRRYGGSRAAVDRTVRRALKRYETSRAGCR